MLFHYLYYTLFFIGLQSICAVLPKERYCKNNAYNKQPSRTAMIKAANADTFGFDCVCLIKGALWGWNSDKNAVYGGAKYESNDVSDRDCNVIFDKCSGKTTDFSKIEVGKAVWLQGHIGVYIGDVLAVECTPSWKNCVQITAVANIGAKSGYNSRRWTKHGKLPYVTYEGVSSAVNKAKFVSGKTNAPVNVRGSASISGTVVAKLPKGTAVKMTGKIVEKGGYT